MLNKADAETVFALALDSPVQSAGGNSTVKRVTYSGRDFAVKDYSSRPDGRARQIHEFAALTFLHPEMPARFAEPLAVAPDGLRAIHSWLPGVRPALDSSLVSGMLKVVADLHELAERIPKGYGFAATDQVLAPIQLFGQVFERLACLTCEVQPVKDFASEQVAPLLAELAFSDDILKPPTMTLSLSDFGPHNLLRQGGSGDLRCVDLEFFGWDDAHKLILDTLLHPLTEWTSDIASLFIAGAVDRLGLDERRLLVLFPLLSLKWSTITLARAAREVHQGDRLAVEIALTRSQGFVDRSRIAPRSLEDIVASISND